MVICDGFNSFKITNMETVYNCQRGEGLSPERWELRLDGAQLLFYGQGGPKFMPTALPWRIQGDMVRGVASNVKVSGPFADKLLQHLQAGGFIEEELDWFWNSNGTVGLRFNDPLPTVF